MLLCYFLPTFPTFYLLLLQLEKIYNLHTASKYLCPQYKAHKAGPVLGRYDRFYQTGPRTLKGPRASRNPLLYYKAQNREKSVSRSFLGETPNF